MNQYKMKNGNVYYEIGSQIEGLELKVKRNKLNVAHI